MVTVNDFFCGAGGMGLGFKKAGFDIVGAWDFDKYAVQSYAHNVGDHVKQTDITQMSWEDVPKADVWTFGFPCQDLSNAGRQAGLFDGKRSRLFFEVMRLIDEMKTHNPDNLPKILLAENVKGLKQYLPVLKEEYNKRGYRMVFTLFNSKYWGVPQNRERYFVAGIREDVRRAFNFPMQKTDFIPKLSSVLESEVDEKYYISDEKAAKIIEQAINGLKVKQATKKGYDIAVEGDSINISHPNSKTRRGRVGKQVAQTLLTGQEQVVVESVGIRLKDNAKTFSNLQEQTEAVMARDYKGWSKVGMVGVLEVRIDNYRVRKLTPREYARLQGFPESYEQVVSNSQFYKQMGNAVTVNVAEAIAKTIKEYLEKVGK